MSKISAIGRTNYIINKSNVTFGGRKDNQKQNQEDVVSTYNQSRVKSGLSNLIRVGIPAVVLATSPFNAKLLAEEISLKNKTKEEYVAPKAEGPGGKDNLSSCPEETSSADQKGSQNSENADWEKIEQENETKVKAINGDTAGPVMKVVNKTASALYPVLDFLDEHGMNALRTAQNSKGRATVIAGETKGPVGYGASFVTELAGEFPDTVRGVMKRGSDLNGWIKDKTRIYNGDNKALQTLNVTSDLAQMLQGAFQFFESGSSIATGALTYERWRNKNIDKNMKRVNTELARRAVDMSDANAHDSKVILKGRDRMIMAFGEKKYHEMTKKERYEYAKSLPKEMTLEHAKFIQAALKDLPLEDFSKETLIMLAKLSAAQFAAHEHAELRTNYIMEGLKLFDESKTNFRDGASKVLKTPGNLVTGVGEVADIGMVDEDNDFDDKVIEGLFGNKGFLGIFHNTLSAAGNVLTLPVTLVDGKEGSTTETAKTAFQKTKNIGKSFVNMFSLGLTNAHDIWGDYEDDSKNPKSEVQATSNSSEEQYITARQLRVLMVQSSEDTYMEDYNRKLDGAILGLAKALGEKAYADVLSGEQNPDGSLLKKADAAKTQAEQDTLLKLQAARKQAMQLIDKTNSADAKRQARLAEYHNTFFNYFKLEESNDENYANRVPLGKSLLCVGEGFIKTIPYEVLFESNQTANTAILLPFSFLVGGAKIAHEGIQELSDYINLTNGDAYNGALKQESIKGTTKAVTKITTGTVISLIPMIKKFMTIKAKVAAAKEKVSSATANASARASSTSATTTTAAVTKETFAYGTSASASTVNISATAGGGGASSASPLVKIVSPKKIIKDSAKKALKNVLPTSTSDISDIVYEIKEKIAEGKEGTTKK